MNIGLIAGSGQFPIIFSKKAKSNGLSVHAVAFLNETDNALEKHTDSIKWIHLGQIEKLIAFFKKNRVTEAVMIGAIRKTIMFSDVKPDARAISMISRMKTTHDDSLLRVFANELEQEGITIRPSTFLLPDIVATEGCWTKRKPALSENADIEMGWQIAKEIGRLDIGQCVVVGGGSVLAVEAVDGTDATIKRGGTLGKGNAVVVKVSKPNQDLRFDMPAVGARTIQLMRKVGAKALAVEAGKAVVFDKNKMISMADKYGISIVALKNV